MTYYIAKYFNKNYGYYVDTGIKFKTYSEAKSYVEKSYGKLSSNQIIEVQEKKAFKLPIIGDNDEI